MKLYDTLNRALNPPGLSKKGMDRRHLLVALVAIETAACYPTAAAIIQTGRVDADAEEGSLAAVIEGALTQVPVPDPTATPIPPTATPTPDPFNFRTNLYVPVTDANMAELGIQNIVDEYQTALTGRNHIGRFVGIRFMKEKKQVKVGNETFLTSAYITFEHYDNKLTFAEIRILEGMQLWDVVATLANESGKGYTVIDYGQVNQPTAEASAIAFEAAALKTLESKGYRSHIMPNMSFGYNVVAYMKDQLQQMFSRSRGEWRDDIILVNWLAAQDLRQLEKPELTAEDYMERFRRINERGFDHFMRRIERGELMDFGTAWNVLNATLAPRIPLDEARRGLLWQARTMYVR